MGPFTGACQPERHCTAGTRGTETTESYRERVEWSNSHLCAHRKKSRAGGFSIYLIILFSFTSLVKHQLEPVFHFLRSSEAFVRVVFFLHRGKKAGGCGCVQPQRQVEETIWMRAGYAKTGRGTDDESTAPYESRCATAARLDVARFHCAFPGLPSQLIPNLPSLQPRRRQDEDRSTRPEQQKHHRRELEKQRSKPKRTVLHLGGGLCRLYIIPSSSTL